MYLLQPLCNKRQKWNHSLLWILSEKHSNTSQDGSDTHVHPQFYSCHFKLISRFTKLIATYSVTTLPVLYSQHITIFLELITLNLLLCGSGAYISKNSAHYYLPDWPYLRQKSGKNTENELAEHEIKARSDLTTLENPCKDSSLGLIFEFEFFIFWSYPPN